MAHLPPLNAIRMFDAAARHLNFRLAAEELHLTQGAVAQQVRRLETDLGVSLFHREARGLALTEAGKAYCGPVRRALTLLEDATQQLRPEQKQITISVTPSFASKWLVPRLKDFSQAHPEIDLRIMASEAQASFQSDGVDMAVRQGHPPFGADLRAERLCYLDICAVCSPAVAEKVGEIAKLGDLAAYPLLYDAHDLWHTLLETRSAPVPRQILQFSQTALAIDAAGAGQGIALAPGVLVAADIADGRLTCLWRNTTTDEAGFYLVTPKKLRYPASHSAMESWLLDQIQPTGYGASESIRERASWD